MHPPETMQQVISGKRYAVGTATLVASDEYFDGQNWERHGRNTFLYRTPKGAFFEVRITQWQGESDTITPLSLADAKNLYENLREHELEYEDAFGEIPGELEPSPGRPPLYGEAMRQTGLYLPPEQIEWLKNQPGGVSETVRGLIERAMQA